MRRLICLSLGGLLAITACSQQESGDRSAREDIASPNVSPTAAPGVAFEYGYDYSLGDKRISQVQEAHAAACEKLGVSQCRITGLDYQINDHDRVSAMLRVKLDPGIARQFGKQATLAVEQSDGRLVRAQFTGEDVGTQISTAQDQRTALQGRIAEIERRLAATRLDRERAELHQQLDSLRNQLGETAGQIAGGQQRLASTPMTFNYFGEGGIAGFDENPIRESWRLFAESGVMMISVLLKVIGTILPWAILLLLSVLLVRSRVGQAVRNWWESTKPQHEE
jgi:hypothetical protein